MATLLQQMAFAHSEEEVKDTFQNFFGISGAGFGAVDFSIPHIYFEAKVANTDIYRMLAQLVLTIYRDQDKLDLPEYIGGFDKYKCGIIEFDNLWQILTTYNDINWNQTPSAVDDKTINIVKQFAHNDLKIYTFGIDDKELKSVLHKIQNGRGLRGQLLQKKVNANNFVSVFMKWSKELAKNISDIDCEYNKTVGIIPGDFYLADLLSDNNQSIPELEKLKILRDGNTYKSNVNIKGEFFSKEYKIKNPDIHNQFWNKYKRPPKSEYWNVIQERRDLLVPQRVREIKGAFFTPQIWVEKSQEYMANVFGDEFANMYIWDCAAGTGNLLVGLPQERRNIFASTLDEPDVEIMKQSGNFFENQVFQFDFLNDDFIPVREGGKMPDRLYDIIQNPEEQKKLIIYINPPYAEGSSKNGFGNKGKSGVASNNKIYKDFVNFGKVTRELFVLFMLRIYSQIPHSVLTLFSKLKIVSAPNFTVFRDSFWAQYLGGFVVRANTFDNVRGQFPIAFTMWNLNNKQPITNINCDIIENDGSISGVKRFFAYNTGVKFINDWIVDMLDTTGEKIAFLSYNSSDFQNQNFVYLTNKKPVRQHWAVQVMSLQSVCIYFAVRHAIVATWLNDRDQFLFPIARPINNTENLLEAKQEFLYEMDEVFKNNCLIYTLFHTQNRISSNDGINHWIPFSEDMVGCKSAFDSDFMVKYLSERHIPEILSENARLVYEAGLSLWKYYHQYGSNPNASLYDIKDFFKGRNEQGKMNNKSDDAEFNRLESALSSALRALSSDIEPKIYEYGFLRK